MMKYKHVLLISAIVLGFAFSACAPDPIYSYPPEYERKVRFTLDDPKAITLNNQEHIDFISNCQSGDSVIALIRVSYTGVYITKAVYYWALKDASDSTIVEKQILQVAPHKQEVPPTWRFEAPSETGTYYVHFRATYSYSAQAENGTFFGGFPTSAAYEGASTISSSLVVNK